MFFFCFQGLGEGRCKENENNFGNNVSVIFEIRYESVVKYLLNEI